jgi:hypothetical protein
MAQNRMNEVCRGKVTSQRFIRLLDFFSKVWTNPPPSPPLWLLSLGTKKGFMPCICDSGSNSAKLLMTTVKNNQPPLIRQKKIQRKKMKTVNLAEGIFSRPWKKNKERKLNTIFRGSGPTNRLASVK